MVGLTRGHLWPKLVLDPAVKILAFANPVKGWLEDTTEAEELIAAIRACQGNLGPVKK
jgi:hypothetical protein